MDLIFSLSDIATAASKLLAISQEYKVIAFHGEMGAGKTTLVHALCTALGVKGNISSPTFSIINEYSTPAGDPVYHIDLYRVKDNMEAINAGVEDCLYSGQACWVEWPERAPSIFPEKTLHISILVVDTNTRKLQINL